MHARTTLRFELAVGRARQSRTAPRFFFALCGALVFFVALALTQAAGAAPPPNPSSTVTPVTTAVTNIARTLFIRGWMDYCDRYERLENVVILSAGQAQIKALTCDFTTGGTAVPFGVDTTLTLTFDGVPVATAAVTASDSSVTFNVDLTSIPEAWYMASVTGLDSSWSILDYGVYVLKGAVAQPHSQMPVTTASHELIFEGQNRYQQTWVPTKFEPVAVPYAARAFPDLPTMPTRKDVVITSLAVPRPNDIYRPALTKEGVWTTANREDYFWYDFEKPKPILPMLDGPRGVGSIIEPVHLEVGNAAPNGALRGNVYFIEAWRIGKVTPDGTVVTLAGYRHKDMASYWNDPTSAELVGDWSSIPPARRGFAQPWGMAWDPRTLVINESAAPIPSENNEKPHIYGPVLYVSDTFQNRILKLQYIATAHGVPPTVTEFVTGLNQPWDVIADGTQLYVSDRMNNAIKVFDMDTAALVKTIPVVQPEGMALLDGWLYYASILTKSIRKINLATGDDVLIADPSVTGSKMAYYLNSNNARFMKIAVSDGSFGPRGMIAYTTWANTYFGYPILIDGATGNMIDWLQVNSGDVVKGTSPLGLHSYSSAVGIGHGRMLFGTVEEGLHVVSKALPTDPVIDSAKYTAGKDQWQAAGYGLTHGPGGYGYYGLPLPWGETPEIDYFLEANLHTPDKLGDGTIAANPYGALSVQGAAIAGNAISSWQSSATIQLGNTAGTPGSYAEIDFQGLNVGPGSTLTIQSGAPGQAVILYSTALTASYISGTLQTQGGNGAAPPLLYLHNPNGVTIVPSGIVNAPGGLTLDALGASLGTGSSIVNGGVVDGGFALALLGGTINGGGAFKGDAIAIRTFGSANNPVNGPNFLANGLQLYPSTGSSIALTLNAYGTAPQYFNVMLNGSGTLAMPSAWPSGSTWPANNAVVPPGGTRASGVPDPAYGGGSMIVQASGDLSLFKGPTNDLTFPGGIVLKAAGTLDVNGVTLNNAWTTSGKAFQGLYFEAPNIISTGGNISVLTNNKNWVNFNVKPTAPVRTWQFVRASNGSASQVAADLIAPHLNTYSILINAAASGGCWTCLVNPTAVDMY
jgi:filamentous hemagglutinin family protein